MGPRRWFGGFGTVLTAVVVYALLRPRPTPTRFESGYGLSFVGQRVTGRGGLREVTRFFASPERFDTVAQRLDREFVPSPALEGMRMWSLEKGLVTASASKPVAAPNEGWPAGTSTYLTTFEVSEPSLLQRAARAVGIRL